ncbi:hypothetical protein IQ37_09940 [Chryseobacterium piperi]|uniref:Uncharacterized protein n=1 Tax=Chryseobacterium piperi TaxID=558152 RepID=A0A086BIC8_9FLAO|nr:hypothetical protein [Chryseobacterium piperi]ASW73004.1 hypothetical protein CJF12_01005 [Chryseobacterium piperi]KFF28692.1 hypothetical protein IQ37_09940 [Chryseobacterium piperi]
MAENDKDATKKAAKADPTTPEEKAVVFVNTEVLSPPPTDPMLGAAKIMIDQSTGMMVQDLQSFLKGFEQVGLVALSKLAFNYLTYGNYHPPVAGGSKEKAEEVPEYDPEKGNGNAMMKDLFKIVSDYAEAKTKLSGTIYNNNTTPFSNGIPDLPPLADIFGEEEDPEKKNE